MSELSEQVRTKIQTLVESDRVVVFMKGTRRAPQCGFSASVVELLDGWLDDYASVDVLADPELREGIKVFSEWPTIPQLYVGGEFVGGADILAQLEAEGELRTTLGAPEPAPPDITVTEGAAAQLRAAMAGGDIDPEDTLRLTIDGRFRNDLSVGPGRPGDLVAESAGLKIAFDHKSARRARGLTIDFVDGPEGTGFKIDNPNAPPSVRELTVEDLAQRLAAAKDSGEPLHLYDVRTPGERELASIEGTVLLEVEVADQIAELPRDTPLYFHCHHGGRSQRAAQHFIDQGFTEVYNIIGGIDAWSQRIDPKVPRY